MSGYLRYARRPRENCPEVRRPLVEVACSYEDNLPEVTDNLRPKY